MRAAAVPAVPMPVAPVPTTTCEVFPADNVWHMDVSVLPKHPKSKVWKRASHAGSTDLHPDFGPPSYGIPFDVVDAAHPDVSIDFSYAGESDPGPYPFGPDIEVEGGSDRHALMVDADTCMLYELFDARWNAGEPRAGSGAIFDLASNALRPAGWTSADAAGLPIFPGLVRWDEVQAGVIDHAIRFTVAARRDGTCGLPATRRAWPTVGARRWARGSGSRPASIPRGSGRTARSCCSRCNATA